MKLRRGLAISLAASAGAALLGCTGILGLDATALAGPDASTGDGASTDGTGAPPDGTSDVGDGGGDSPTTGDGSGDAPATGDGQPSAPVFTTSPATIGLHPDASVDVTVSVQRDGLTGSLSITFVELPAGVTSGTSTIAADAGSTQVTVTASGSAPVATSDAGLQSNGATVATVPVVVYGPSGSTDGTFGGGIVVDKAEPTSSVFASVAIDPQGRVVAGGPRAGGGWLLRRFAGDGSADTAFDTAANAALPSTGSLNGLAIDPSTGVVVCVGVLSSELTVVVLDANGNASGAFNSGSPFSLTPTQSQSSAANAVAIQPGQKFVVVGGNGPALDSFLIAGIPEMGTPQLGGLSTYGGGANTSFSAVAVTPSGQIVAAGTTGSGTPAILLDRLNGGALDVTFGDGGTAAGSTAYCAGSAVAVRPTSGAVLVGGSDVATNVGCFSGWNDAGKVTFQNTGGSGGGGAFTYWGAAPAVDVQDHVYMVGSGGDTFGWSAEIDRVNQGGALDTSFGNGGRVALADTNSPPLYAYVFRSVVVQPDGRIVVAGSKKDSTGTFPMVARFWP